MILAIDRPVPAIRVALNHSSIVALGSCRGATLTHARTERLDSPADMTDAVEDAAYAVTPASSLTIDFSAASESGSTGTCSASAV